MTSTATVKTTYGGVFVAGSLARGMIADGFRSDRYDVAASSLAIERG